MAVFAPWARIRRLWHEYVMLLGEGSAHHGVTITVNVSGIVVETRYIGCGCGLSFYLASDLSPAELRLVELIKQMHEEDDEEPEQTNTD